MTTSLPRHARGRIQRTDLKRELLERRYLLKDGNGRVIETEQQMCERVARTVAQVEAVYGGSDHDVSTWTQIFARMMLLGEFLPNSPTLMNAGRTDGSLSGCFVLPVPDSIDGIFESIKDTALIQKAGGGTGFAFGELRPTGDLVASSGGRTSGPISFWRAFSEASNAIQQGAFRRGANMGMMYTHHPDIIKFLHAKQDLNAFTNYNISVKLTDEWMRQFLKDPESPHLVRNPRTGEAFYIPRDVKAWEYDIRSLIPAESASPDPNLSPRSQTPRPKGPVPADYQGKVYTKRDIWDSIVTNAWRTGEPGVCFIDRINEANPTPHLGRIEATNPCGEQPLLPYESCNLGSIDLSKFIDREGSLVRWDELRSRVAQAVRFLDDVIDANRFPTARTDEVTRGNRKIGLGVMGFADALMLLGIRYDSEQAVHFARQVSVFVTASAHDASEQLAHERGCFPNWEDSIWDTDHHQPMRHAACTTIAPTGSISIIAGCSSGIEPIYSYAVKRHALDGEEFIQVHPLLEELGVRNGWLSDDVRAMLAQGYPPTEIPGFPDRLAKALVTAHEVPPEWHVRVQAAFQEHIDSAVSKTVNLPADATVRDVEKTFFLAHELGCKGITVYRDGSREGQTLTTAARVAKTPGTVARRPRRRDRVASGGTSKFRTGCGTLFVTVNQDDHGLCEVFANLGKGGGCPSQSEATCRAVSVALRSGVDPDVLIEQLKGIRCLSAARRANGNVDVLSCPDAIARALREACGEVDAASEHEEERRCPDCGQDLRKEAGCMVCGTCGYSKCG